MKFENKLTLPAPRERVWELLMDVPQVSSCMPGVQSVSVISDDQFQAAMKVKIGPVSLNLDVNATVDYRDRERWEAAMSSEARDRRIGGSARAKVTMRLLETENGVTEMAVESDVVFMGRLGEFGQPLVRKKTNDMFQEFGKNLQARLSG
ncbi:MAG TPA: SRPBCC family protein [Dehalococcoidia bacterium]|nr:SRPBCC family protein [Dehalococcoidia bacterium]